MRERLLEAFNGLEAENWEAATENRSPEIQAQWRAAAYGLEILEAMSDQQVRRALPRFRLLWKEGRGNPRRFPGGGA